MNGSINDGDDSYMCVGFSVNSSYTFLTFSHEIGFIEPDLSQGFPPQYINIILARSLRWLSLSSQARIQDFLVTLSEYPNFPVFSKSNPDFSREFFPIFIIFGSSHDYVDCFQIGQYVAGSHSSSIKRIFLGNLEKSKIF